MHQPPLTRLQPLHLSMRLHLSRAATQPKSDTVWLFMKRRRHCAMKQSLAAARHPVISGSLATGGTMVMLTSGQRGTGNGLPTKVMSGSPPAGNLVRADGC